MPALGASALPQYRQPRPEPFFCGLGRGGLLDALRCISAGMIEPAWVVPGQSMESWVQDVEWFEQLRI